ncbi:hypothetical protein BWI93_13420, partial [Siphonobacter sp. BAB-5385]|uniref:hypothetical protein n=1 Tax=Siphonobacter sp. BAB-5385 TaxID=1864822 RepID=UPI000BC81199
ITKDQIDAVNENIVKLMATNSVEIPEQSDVLVSHPEKPSLNDLIKQSSTYIYLNIQLPNYLSIMKFLEQERLPIEDTFGHDKVDLGLLSFGIEVDVNILKLLINNVHALGIRYIKTVGTPNVSGPQALNVVDIESRSIYIGSYNYQAEGNKRKKMVNLNEFFIELINSCKSTQEITDLVDQNETYYSAYISAK